MARGANPIGGALFPEIIRARQIHEQRGLDNIRHIFCIKIFLSFLFGFLLDFKMIH
jgi:hypothetical protein